MKKLGTTLSQLRSEKGLAQKEMAACLNLSISAISSYENDVHAPDPVMLCRLAEFFGVTTDYLLGRTEPLKSISLRIIPFIISLTQS